MAPQTIAKDRLDELIAAVNATGKFVAPQRHGTHVALVEVASPADLALDYSNTESPLKNWFFPRVETVARHDAGGIEVGTTPDGTPTVIFGARPCDVRSLMLLDKIFMPDDVVDPYYGTRRECATIIALACAEPAHTCFCESLGGSPSSTDGADVFAYQLDGAFLLEGVSDKGAAFMAQHASVFADATEADLAARDAQIVAAAGKATTPELDQAIAAVRGDSESDAWEEITTFCLACGACAYSCPTCHCFGLHDEQGTRLKAQHSCMLPDFTFEASGHNPRSDQGARMRQRILHKFRYTVENQGDVFCVGCGRCIANCPVNIDIRETLQEVAQ